MDFAFYLPAHWPDVSRHAVHVYREMLAEARAAERLGFSSLLIPEHHFVNYLTHPNPLLTAVKVAGVTERIPIVTSVLVLPFYDMRRLAGEIAQADCLTDGRLQIGVGRGAFEYEFRCFNQPTDAEEQRRRFDDALELLKALMTREEVSWKSPYYDFGPLTTTPRPLQKPYPPIWIAAVTPPGIYHSAKNGYHVQTMPLRTVADGPRLQSEAMYRARSEGADARLSMLQFVFVTENAAETERILRICHTAQRRFHNMFSTPGQVRGGDIVPIEIDLTIEQLAERTVIGTTEECYDKLKVYAELGVDEVVCNMSFGVPHELTLKSMQRLADGIMPALARIKPSLLVSTP